MLCKPKCPELVDSKKLDMKAEIYFLNVPDLTIMQGNSVALIARISLICKDRQACTLSGDPASN